MKKLLLIPLILMIFLSGCKSTDEKKPVTSGLEFEAKAEYNSKDYLLKVIITDPQNIKAEVKKPDSLNGFTVTYENKKIKCEYLGISYEPETDVPLNSIANLMFACISDLDNGKIREDGNYYLNGSAGNIDYKYTYSPLGLPISLDIPDKNLKIIFKNVKSAKTEKEPA